MLPDRAPQTIPSELLLSALAVPERLAVYVSRGWGPLPWGEQPEQPEFVRVAVMTGAPLAAVQAAGEVWLGRAAKLLAEPPSSVEAGELVAPRDGSRWAQVPAAGRAELLVQGVALLLGLQPEVGVFYITDEFGAGLLARIQAELAARAGGMDVHTLEALVFASLTYRLLIHPGEAVVVTAGPDEGWSLRQVFPEQASVWRHAIGRAPPAALAGLSFTALAEQVVWATTTQRGRREIAAGPAEFAAALAEAEASLRPRLANLLRERPGGSGGN